MEQKTGVHLAGTVAVGGASLPPHRTHVALCLRRHHPAAALPDAGGKQAPPPPVPQRAAAGRMPLERRLGTVTHWKYSGVELGRRGTLLPWAAQQFPRPPSGPSCGNLTTDKDIRVDGEPAGTSVWDTSLSFCTGCGEWREWGEQPASFLEACPRPQARQGSREGIPG